MNTKPQDDQVEQDVQDIKEANIRAGVNIIMYICLTTIIVRSDYDFITIMCTILILILLEIIYDIIDKK